jgi:hypothetical protein
MDEVRLIVGVHDILLAHLYITGERLKSAPGPVPREAGAALSQGLPRKPVRDHSPSWHVQVWKRSSTDRQFR